MLSPRTPIQNAPYALQSQTAELAYAVPNASIGGAQIVPSQVQARVGGSCAGGSSINAIGADGSVSCQSVGAGTISGVTAGTGLSVAAQTVAAVPVIWAGMMLVVVFAHWLGWLPAQGFPRGGWSTPAKAFESLLLPALTIGLVEGALLMRFVRSATLQAAGQDFVRTAAAKGLTRRQALIRHGIPAVGLSIVTVLGLQVAGIIVGSVVIEQLFTLPGIGRMLVADVGTRDLVKVQSELLVLTGFVLIIGFIVDLVHHAIDPRQREAE